MVRAGVSRPAHAHAYHGGSPDSGAPGEETQWYQNLVLRPTPCWSQTVLLLSYPRIGEVIDLIIHLTIVGRDGRHVVRTSFGRPAA